VLNGLRLEATDAELVVAIVALAGGELSDEELAHWFRERVAQRGGGGARKARRSAPAIRATA
jgi:hypothetical protein